MAEGFQPESRLRFNTISPYFLVIVTGFLF